MALSAHLRYLWMSTMFACVTFSCVSTPSEVGGMSSTRVLSWEARIGAVAGSVVSVVAFFFKSAPFTFGHSSCVMTTLV